LDSGHLAFRILDQFSVGVVLLDQSARVLFANAAAQSLSENGGPLRLNSGITHLSPEHARRLGDIVRSGLSGTRVRTMCLPSSSRGRPLMILVAPAKGAEPHRSDFCHLRSAAAILFVCDPGSPGTNPSVLADGRLRPDAWGSPGGACRIFGCGCCGYRATAAHLTKHCENSLASRL
jgi:hypothetical protein